MDALALTYLANNNISFKKEEKEAKEVEKFTDTNTNSSMDPISIIAIIIPGTGL